MHTNDSTITTYDGLTLHCRAWTPDAPPKGVIMLLHGLGEHLGRYEHVAAALVDAGYAVHAVDHRGHGRSEGKRAYVKSYDEFMRDIAQFRGVVEAAHQGVPFVILGHSMGGNLAMGHVLDHPAGVAGLVLSGPALKIGDDFSPVQLKIFRTIAKVAPGFRPQGLSADAISRDPAVVEAYRNDPLVFTGKISAGLGAALFDAMEQFPARYASLKMPILIVHGTEDQLADIAGSRALEAAAVNAEVTSHYYTGLYHEVFNEPEQQQVLADVITWLDQIV